MSKTPATLGGFTLSELLIQWKTVLKSERKAISTIKSYVAGVESYIAWCERRGLVPAIDRMRVTEWTADLLANGNEASTARNRQAGLRLFSSWLANEDDIPYDDLLLGIKPPKLAEKLVQPLTERQLKLMILACDGKALRDRRDEAIIRIMSETGMRIGEVIALCLDDIDVDAGRIRILKTKTGLGRVVSFGPEAGVALNRYLRLRKSHKLASTPKLWLGERGAGLSYMGLRASLMDRAELAGIEKFHPHLFRHTLATRWLDAGGSPQGLMATAGWSDPAMLHRYTRATASNRAMDEARRLDLGNI